MSEKRKASLLKKITVLGKSLVFTRISKWWKRTRLLKITGLDCLHWWVVLRMIGTSSMLMKGSIRAMTSFWYLFVWILELHW